MTTTDASLFPFNTDRIQDISKEDGKLFIVTDDDRRFILKLVEIGPIAEHQTLFYFNPETKEPVFRNKTAYKCSVWHVGRGKTILTDEDKRKLKIKHNIR